MYDWRFGDDKVSQLGTNKPLAKTTLKLMLAFYRGSASYLLLFSMKGRFYCSFSFYLTAMKCRQTFTVWDFELIPFSTMTDLQSEPSCDFSCATECLPDLWRTREPKSSQTHCQRCCVSFVRNHDNNAQIYITCLLKAGRQIPVSTQTNHKCGIFLLCQPQR